MPPTSMRALVLTATNKVGVVEKPVPEPGPLDALVRTTASSICTTDVRTVAGTIPVPLGRVLGHESAGVIAAVGGEVTRFREGDRVVAPAITPCGCCDYCQNGFPGQCGGMHGGLKWTIQRDGNLSEYFVVPHADHNLTTTPDDVTDEQALYAADVLDAGLTGAEHAAIPLGGTVAIFAQGPVGLCATIGARLLGAGLVVTTATRPDRAALSKHFGADVIIDPREEDAVERVRALVGQDGVDSAIEALGTHETFEDAVRVTKATGTVVNLGYHGWRRQSPLPVPVMSFGMGLSAKTIRAALPSGGGARLSRVLRLIRTGRVDPSPLTTHRFTFDDVERAFDLMRTKRDGIVKPLVTY